MSEQVQPATLTCTPIQPVSGGALSLGDFLTYVCSSWSGELQGMAFATNGTWPVLGIDRKSSKDSQELSVAPVEGHSFDDKKVFELRLWVPVTHTDDPKDGTLLAHEFRWVNGMGAVDLTLEPGTERNGTTSVSGWAHNMSYLKHMPAGSDTGRVDNSQMMAVEFIQEEKQYGNMVVTDQLFTGEWTL
nr:hypothetical protein [Schaalia odontolytica]